MLFAVRKLSRVLFLLLTITMLSAPALTEAEETATATSAPSVETGEASKLTPLKALVLGMVEGLTEYLPVSSTGHLLLAERLLGISGDTSSVPSPEKQRERDAADAYTICIQAGAIIAVLGLYMKRIKRIFAGIMGRDAEGLKMAVNIVTGFLPAAVIGLLIVKIIKAYLFGVWPVVAAWFCGGVAILLVAWYRDRKGSRSRMGKTLDELNCRMALVIGLAQCIAMWPGVSRSLVTIVGGLMVGLSMPAAVEFSFLLGVVTLGAATSYDALKHGHDIVRAFDLVPVAIGLVAAFVFAVLSVKWMVAYLNRHGLAVFGYYRVALAVVVGLLLLTGKM